MHENIKIIKFGYDIAAPTFIGEMVYDNELDKEVMINPFQLIPRVGGGFSLMQLNEPFGKPNNNVVIIPNDNCIYFEPKELILKEYIQMKTNIVIANKIPEDKKIILDN